MLTLCSNQFCNLSRNFLSKNENIFQQLLHCCWCFFALIWVNSKEDCSRLYKCGEKGAKKFKISSLQRYNKTTDKNELFESQNDFAISCIKGANDQSFQGEFILVKEQSDSMTGRSHLCRKLSVKRSHNLCIKTANISGLFKVNFMGGCVSKHH